MCILFGLLAAYLLLLLLHLIAELSPCEPGQKNKITAIFPRAAAVSGIFWLLCAGFCFFLFDGPAMLQNNSIFRFLTPIGLALWMGGTRLLFRLRRHAPKRWQCRCIAMAALCALCFGLESFVFNAQYFITHDYTDVSIMPHYISDDLLPDQTGALAIADDADLAFCNVDERIYNIALTYNYNRDDHPAQPDSFCKVTVSVWDDAWRNIYSPGSALICESIPQSNVITLHDTSTVRMLYLHFDAYGGEATQSIVDYSLQDVRINVARPFVFHLSRFLFLLAFAAFGFCVRPGSVLWREQFLQNRKKRLPLCLALGGYLALEFVVLAVFLPNHAETQLAFDGYNTEHRNGSSPIEFLAVPDGSPNSQYVALTQSLLEGHFYLDYPTDSALAALEHPYNVKERENSGAVAYWDHAFYGGKYYVYFGIVPALLFQLPFALITGQNCLPLFADILFAGWLFLLAAFLLVRRMAQLWFPRISSAGYLLCVTSFILLSNVLYLVRNPFIYEVPILCGVMFTAWGLAEWLAALQRQKHASVCLHLFFGSLCMALVAGCRPQMVLGSALALPLFGRHYFTEKRLFSRRGATEAVCFALPYIFVAAGLMYYNFARFSSPFDFGANYNLTTNDMTTRGFSTLLMALGVYHLLLQPANLCAEFPFLRETLFDTDYMGIMIQESTFGGLLFCNPVCWVGLFAFSRAWLRELRARKLLSLVFLPFLLCLVLATLDSEMAGIVQRYMADFSVFLAVGVILVLLLIEDFSRITPAYRPLFIKVFLILFSGCAVYQTLLMLGCDITLLDHNPTVYLHLLHSVAFWL